MLTLSQSNNTSPSPPPQVNSFSLAAEKGMLLCLTFSGGAGEFPVCTKRMHLGSHPEKPESSLRRSEGTN